MIIEIDGVGKVEVADTFGTMSSEDQDKLVREIVLSHSKNRTTSQQVSKPVESQRLRSVAQGATLGFADELEAAIRNPASFIGHALNLSDGKNYQERLDIVRKKLESYRSDSPLEALAYEIGGAILPSVGAGAMTFGAGTGAVGTATAARLAPTLARAAKIGLAEGAIAGFGASEGGVENRLSGAAMGGALGGVAGSLTPVLTQSIGRGIRNVGDTLGVGGAKRANTFAERKVLEALERDQITPQEALTRIISANEMGSSGTTLADLGENLRSAAWRAQATPNDMRQEIIDQFSMRRAGQAAQVSDVTSRMMNVEGLTGKDYLDDLAETVRRQSAPAYRKAYEIDLDAAPFQHMAKSNVVQKAYKEAIDLADIDPDIDITNMPADLGKFLGNPEDGVEKIFMPTEVAHNIKKGLDSLIDSETDALTNKMSHRGAKLVKLKKAWNEEIIKQNEPYANANIQFADKMKLRSAYDTGFKFTKIPEKDLVLTVSKMTKEEAEAMRVGLVSQIEELASTTGDTTDFVNKLFMIPRRRAALRLSFNNNAKFNEFEKFIRLEADKMSTYRKVFGGSDTAERLMQKGDAEIDPSAIFSTATQLATGNYGGAATSMGSKISSRLQGFNEKNANSMSKMLFSADPTSQAKILQDLTQRQALDEASRRSILNRPEFYSGLIGTEGGLLSGRSN